MSKNQHFFDDLVDLMKEDLATMSEVLSDTFVDFKPFRPRPKQPSPKQQAMAFLGMSQEARQRLALDVGPEAYQSQVMDYMTDLVGTIGPGAQKLLPYFMAPMDPGDMEPDRGTLEAELMDMLNAPED